MTHQELAAGWRALLATADSRSRSRFLLCVSEMVPVLRALGGQATLEEAFVSITETSALWS